MSKLPLHIHNYYDFFGLEPGDWVGSEISGESCMDFHHIYEKGMGGRKHFKHEGIEYHIDDVNNVIAVTRDQHNDCHAVMYTKDQLMLLHSKTMRNHLMKKHR